MIQKLKKDWPLLAIIFISVILLAYSYAIVPLLFPSLQEQYRLKDESINRLKKELESSNKLLLAAKDSITRREIVIDSLKRDYALYKKVSERSLHSAIYNLRSTTNEIKELLEENNDTLDTTLLNELFIEPELQDTF